MTTHLLTYVQATQRLGISPRSVRRLVADGHLTVVYPRPKCPRLVSTAIDAYYAHLAPENVKAAVDSLAHFGRTKQGTRKTVS